MQVMPSGCIGKKLTDVRSPEKPSAEEPKVASTRLPRVEFELEPRDFFPARNLLIFSFPDAVLAPQRVPIQQTAPSARDVSDWRRRSG